MIVSVLQFIQIRDPRILVEQAKRTDGWLYVLGSDDPKRRRHEGRDVKRQAHTMGFTADYIARRQAWAIQDERVGAPFAIVSRSP